MPRNIVDSLIKTSKRVIEIGANISEAALYKRLKDKTVNIKKVYDKRFLIQDKHRKEPEQKENKYGCTISANDLYYPQFADKKATKEKDDDPLTLSSTEREEAKELKGDNYLTRTNITLTLSNIGCNYEGNQKEPSVTITFACSNIKYGETDTEDDLKDRPKPKGTKGAETEHDLRDHSKPKGTKGTKTEHEDDPRDRPKPKGTKGAETEHDPRDHSKLKGTKGTKTEHEDDPRDRPKPKGPK